jgi:thiamine pyrophosphate-dependent acetolactate synthase large subunit-like protein
VIVLSGDGSLLMNLGSLVTIAGQAPRNLVVVVFVNGVYEVTGAQVTPGTAVDFVGLANASGIKSVFRWSTPEEWRAGVDEALGGVGPTVIVLDVDPVPGAVGPRSPGPNGARVERFRRALLATPDRADNEHSGGGTEKN